MSTRRIQGPAAFLGEELRFPTLDDELEEAADLLPQQEPPETLLPARRRPDPSTPTDYADPSMIDPAD